MARRVILARTAAARMLGRAARSWAAFCLTAHVTVGVASAADPATQGQPTRPTHWAFQPVQHPPVSHVLHPARNEIDSFVFAKLAEKKLAASPEADRRTLIRRLYFDVVGLPPLPEEVAAFERDPSPEAWDTLVERLLASPHYGERWGRHWLDVVRFAETHGFEMNQPRPNAWPYRDYVIRAFNEDKPYNQFVLEQLAGDALGAEAATGFLVAGPWDQVKSPDPVLTSNQRADELHDMVNTTGTAFLGLTLGCARCHSHKFDPIPQADYYAIKACFAGVQHGERKINPPDQAAREKETDRRRGCLTAIDALLAEFEPLAAPAKTAAPETAPTGLAPARTNFLRAPVQPRRNVERFAPVPAKKVRFTIRNTTGAEPCIDELEVYTAEAAPRNIALVTAGTKARASGVLPNFEFHKLEHINDGQHGNSRSWISHERGQGWVELEFAEQVNINTTVWGRDREGKFLDRLPIDYRIEVASGSEDWQVVADSNDRQPYVADRSPRPVFKPSGLSPAEQNRLEQLLAERTEHETRLQELGSAPMIYAGVLAEPEPTYRFHRGDPMQAREPIVPGPLTAWPGPFPIAPEQRQKSSDQQRRLALAQWIADPANPLTSRVMVNRIWQHHFGEGLVSTPSDFGANGARPTHPELLDWLASEFMARGWSIKSMHRLILRSATYRQSSAGRSDGLAVDAESRLLWRFPPRRLEAEPIRDAMLAVSGQLDVKMGGPGFSFFAANDNYVRVYNPKQEFGPADWRRMVYGTVVRQRPDGVFGVFDCPDGGQIAPKRTRSTTPLQALNLLNSGFIMQQAGLLARRLEREAGPEAEAQVARAFALAFQRAPEPDEMPAAVTLVRAQGLAMFCRALFNANEFVYLF